MVNSALKNIQTLYDISEGLDTFFSECEKAVEEISSNLVDKILVFGGCEYRIDWSGIDKDLLGRNSTLIYAHKVNPCNPKELIGGTVSFNVSNIDGFIITEENYSDRVDKLIFV